MADANVYIANNDTGPRILVGDQIFWHSKDTVYRITFLSGSPFEDKDGKEKTTFTVPEKNGEPCPSGPATKKGEFDYRVEGASGSLDPKIFVDE